MKILFMSHQTETNDYKVGTGHKLNIIFKARGHDVRFMLKKKWHVAFWWPYYCFAFIIEYIKFRPDVILTYQQISMLPAFLKKIGFVKRAKVIHYWWDYYTEVVGRKWNPAISSYLEYYAVKNSDSIITNSRYLESIANNIGIKVLGFIPPGVESFFGKDKWKDLCPGDNAIKIIYSGEQSEYKGVDKLIRAVEDLKCDLILIGKANEEMQNIAGNNVYFLGEMHQIELCSYLARADIAVITSDQDSCLKMWEYIKMNKCILARKGRIGYILTHGQDAWLVDDFREGIIYLMKNPNIRQVLEKGTEKFKVDNWDENADKHLELIEREVNKNG